MRAVLTSLLAVAASGLAGSIVAQQLAVRTGAGEEFIAVFFFDMLVLLVATPAFLIAQFFGPRAVVQTAFGLIGLFVLLLAGLWGFAIWQGGPPASRHADTLLIGSIALSGLVILVVHGAVVRWRMG